MEIQGDIASIPVTQDEFANAVKRDFRLFLDEFQEVSAESSDAGEEMPKFYFQAAQEMRVGDKTTLYVNFAHIRLHNNVLADSIEQEYYRFEPFLREAVREFVVASFPDYDLDDKDHRREFFVAFYNQGTIYKLRALNTSYVGSLVSFRGTIVRTSAVHPELISGTFQCRECTTIIDRVAQQFKYTEPNMCRNPTCQNRKDFQLILEDSKFADFQKVRVQEPSDDIPSGSMPRSLDVVLRNDAVEKAKAGDRVVLTGTLVVVPDVAQLAAAGGRVSLASGSSQRSADGYSQEGISGLKALGVRDMTYKLAFLATTVTLHEEQSGFSSMRSSDEQTSEAVAAELTQEERSRILEMKEDPEVYRKLAESIAPTVCGHDEVKRGILLMLFGGLHKKTPDGISLRGDINVCIVGDPSTSKSQFLKYVSEFVPRSVYTSGKASSAAGLTAAVVKDEDSNEFYVEAGALMLADNGVCCIDEFDKMDQKDQVAIHEAMEQQTISITKAGIQATLNARTSVLAAANPINGRYDRAKPLRANVNMTSPIMSRFDLFFVIVDECNEVTDYNIARHITNLHRLKEKAVSVHYEPLILQKYMKFARTLKPRITESALKLIVSQYVKLRQGDSTGINKQSYRITVRQLESLIRLSEALARVYCSDEVTHGHVAEACRLLKKSIIRVETEDVELREDEAPPSQAAMGTEEDPQPGTPSGSAPEDGSKAPVSVSYDKYMRIAHAVVRYLQRREAAQEEDEIGVAKVEVVKWYVEQLKEVFQSEEETLAETALVRLVIHRLVHTDNVLLEIGRDKDGTAIKDDDKILVVHPNYSS